MPPIWSARWPEASRRGRRPNFQFAPAQRKAGNRPRACWSALRFDQFFQFDGILRPLASSWNGPNQPTPVVFAFDAHENTETVRREEDASLTQVDGLPRELRRVGYHSPYQTIFRVSFLPATLVSTHSNSFPFMPHHEGSLVGRHSFFSASLRGVQDVVRQGRSAGDRNAQTGAGEGPAQAESGSPRRRRKNGATAGFRIEVVNALTSAAAPNVR